MHILVTGRSGAGKTAVCTALQEMNFPAFDADRVEGLAGWVDVRSGRPTEVEYSQPIDKRNTNWLWAKPVLKDFLAANNSSILCGSADNQLEFYPLFDRVIFLKVPQDEQIRRIHSRGEGEYGTAPGMAERIVAEQGQLLVQSRELGAVIMNAHRPPEAIACDISKHLR